eukprot:jgi/Mesvir1/21721/Mv04133-RA.1
MPSSALISAVAWVPRGAPKETPRQRELTEEELAAAATEGSDGWEEASDDDDEMGDEEDRPRPKSSSKKTPTADEMADELAELDMDHYDDDDDNQADINRLFGRTIGGAKFISNEDDPYITTKEEDDAEDDEIEDFTIHKNDICVLATRHEDDVSHLEVWVYSDTTPEKGEEEGSVDFYVHHDILLGGYPLCVAWMDCDPRGAGASSGGSLGNFAAVGTFKPEIEFWDLDVLDDVEPVLVLGGEKAPAVGGDEGGEGEGKKEKKKKKKKKKAVGPDLKPGSHTDAVMALTWNAEYRNVLASGSADYTVKVWDITAEECKHTLTHHRGKVQSVLWNPQAPTVLLTGSFDRTAQLADMRAPDTSKPLKWELGSDVEAAAWDPHSPQYFVVSTEDGLVKCFDVRGPAASGAAAGSSGKGKGQGGRDASSSLYTLSAHDGATSSLSFNAVAPQLLATASTDKMIKLWDTTAQKPSLVTSQDLDVGAVFAVSFCKDSPFLLSAGGSKGKLVIWDTMNTAAVVQKYGKYEQQQS